MPIAASETETRAILGALRAVALAGESRALTELDRTTLAAAARITLRHPLAEGEALPEVTPAALADLLGRGALAEQALRLLTVIALVDGSLDAAKIALVTAYAAALGIEESYVADLAEAARGHLQWAMGHMIRENMESITNRPWRAGVTDEVAAWLLPYRGAGQDPALAARFQALAALPEESLGRHLWRHFRDNGYAFPGESEGLNARFSLPHDSAHVLAGYDTTSGGEILVSTFTAAMHPANSMAAHVLPVILSWHLGIRFNEVARSDKGALQPARFFEAWERGAAATVDLFAEDWDFWAAAARPLEALRRDYAILPCRE